MHIRKKFFSILLLLTITTLSLFGDLFPKYSIIEDDTIYDTDTTLTIWYTDACLDEYLRNASVVYEQETGVRVVATYVSGLEYLEAIQKATIDDEMGPDLFVVESQSLEKAYLSGLCTKVKDPENVLNNTYFPQTSLDAVTYSESKLGYPLLFEGSLFIYNRSFLEQMADSYNESIAPAEDDGSGAVEVTINDNGEIVEPEEVPEPEYIIADDLIPKSVVGIIDLALEFGLPEGVESYFKWAVSDVMYDYWFAGAYLNVGGETGDNRDNINIYNEQALYCLEVFKDFKEFFSMELDDYSTDDVLNEFIEGKTLFIVADTDAIHKLESAKKEGTFAYEYGVSSIGMLNSELKSQGLSITKLVAINGFSENKELAEDFASFVSTKYSENLYSKTNKFPCSYQATYQYPQMEDVVRTYENSVSLPKIVETSNYWVLVEMVYTKTWDGGNLNYLLQSLSSQIKKQIYGVFQEETYVETPQIVENYHSDV